MGLYLGGDEVSQKISNVTIGLTLPDQTNNAGKFLTTDGENASWKDVETKQDTLVSGTNIKTINGESILGSGDLEIKSVSGRNVGDIFYTSRTDSELNGAVECNGGTYNIGDFEGAQSVGILLNSGSLPYVSLTEYTSIVSTNGSCRAFGWDGGDTFRVPTLQDVYIEAGTASSAGEFISESLPNVSGGVGACTVIENTSNPFYTSGTSSKGSSQDGTDELVYMDLSRSSSTYKNGAKVKPDSVRYRAMVQLADEALIASTSVLQQIMNKVDRSEADYVVETYQNGTEWYRIYKSGWIEQGGFVTSNLSIAGNSSVKVTIDLLREFNDVKYFVNAQKEGTNLGVLSGVTDKSTTNFVCIFQQYSGNTGNTDSISWFACGQSA